MSTTRAQFRDAVNGAVQAAVTAYNVGKTGANVLQLFFEDVEKANSNDKGNPQFRVFIKHGDSLGQTLGGTGNRLFTRGGQVFVQVMTPFGDGFTLEDTLATLARNIFEGTALGDVWFRNVSAKEIGKTGNWYQTNVVANFEYPERR